MVKEEIYKGHIVLKIELLKWNKYLKFEWLYLYTKIYVNKILNILFNLRNSFLKN
jgi:hypothetical protein